MSHPPGQPPAAFYGVCNERYFLGAVALVNSLRVVGHSEPIFLLDCGLNAHQRELLAPHVTLVPGPADRPPFLVKAIAPLARPARVAVLIDTDMIATRPLTPLIEGAAAGDVVACRDRQQRFFPEWGELLGLGPTRREAYVSSGLVALGGTVGAEVLGLMERLSSEVDFDSTFWRGNVREYPFLYADQDLLNAILATRVAPERLVALDHRLAPTPPFRGLRVRDEDALRCAYADGTEPFVVHQYIRKPWLERMYHGVYSRLLARLLLEEDATVKVPESEIPMRLRRGPLAHAERWRVNVADFMRWHFGDRVPKPIGSRLETIRRRREGERA